MGSGELKIRPEDPVSQNLAEITESRLSPKYTLPMGEEEKDFYVSVCECRGRNLAGEPCHVWLCSVIC